MTAPDTQVGIANGDEPASVPSQPDEAPVRVKLSRAKGWRMPANTVRVARPGRWGNPFNLKNSSHCWTALAHGFKAHAKGRAAASVAMFHAWLMKGEAVEIDCGFTATGKGKTVRVADSPIIHAPIPPSLAEVREHLAGKNLACWCALDAPCHADVLLELANTPTTTAPETALGGTEPQSGGVHT